MALCCWVMTCNARDMASAFPAASATAGPEDFDLDQADANARAAMAQQAAPASVKMRPMRLTLCPGDRALWQPMCSSTSS